MGKAQLKGQSRSRGAGDRGSFLRGSHPRVRNMAAFHDGVEERGSKWQRSLPRRSPAGRPRHPPTPRGNIPARIVGAREKSSPRGSLGADGVDEATVHPQNRVMRMLCVICEQARKAPPVCGMPSLTQCDQCKRDGCEWCVRWRMFTGTHRPNEHTCFECYAGDL